MNIQHSTFNIQHSRLPFLVIAVVALLAFSKPLLYREVPTLRDHFDYFQPLRWFTAEELRHGRLPLWNAYSASGEPWLANPQTAVFYPPAWLFVALPFATAYTLFLALHVMLAGWGAFLLFNRFASQGAALAAALALMFCGPVMSLLDINNNLASFAWIPLVLWCALAKVRPQWSALAIAMSFLAGEPFFAAAGALAFALIRRRDAINVALTSIGFSAIQLFRSWSTCATATVPPAFRASSSCATRCRCATGSASSRRSTSAPRSTSFRWCTSGWSRWCWRRSGSPLAARSLQPRFGRR